jgi:threonyl-tRNA synthetase
MLVVGDQEMAQGQVALRTRRGVDLGKFTIEQVVELFKEQYNTKIID